MIKMKNIAILAIMLIILGLSVNAMVPPLWRHDLSIYPDSLANDFIIAVGDSAPASDVVIAQDLVESLKTETNTPIIRIASEVTDRNLDIITIGKPCNNHLTTLITDVTECRFNLQQDKAIIKSYNFNNNVHIAVVGYSDIDTRRAAKVLLNYNDYDLDGFSACVAGTFDDPKIVDDNECFEEQLACLADVKQCPNGEYVSRDPNNNCEFFPCPVSAVTCPVDCECDSEGNVIECSGVTTQCEDYTYSTCPRGCQQVCTPSSCSEPDENGNVICTSDCDGPRSCISDTTACTADAKQCPNGEYVSRDPNNNCEFFPCPSDTVSCPINCNCDAQGNVLECIVTPSNEFKIELGETKTYEDLSIKFLEVLQDTRCPTNAMCSGKKEKVVVLLNIVVDGKDLGNFKLLDEIDLENHNIQYKWLDPYPEVDSNQQDYVLTLGVSVRADTTFSCPIGCTCDGEHILCPIENEKIEIKDVECPIGCSCEGDQMICNTDEVVAAQGCVMGCKLSDKCVVQGTRTKINEINSYCNLEGDFETQKEENIECQNNFECKTNFCSNNKCYDITKEVEETKNIVAKILDWLKDLFG
ncbi:MAG: hypothetical protein QF632_00710 [Candidatus Woesearchaeota archaeon]|nr:hypothetical protein [Candidatus Woesearchaeota archaeon]MDP7457916.1 hypothetical protein [Candidatus Woesearchaeota archaeon]